MVSHPWFRAALFVVWAGLMVWFALQASKPLFLRLPMAVFALMALGVAVHFARIAVRQRAK